MSCKPPNPNAAFDTDRRHHLSMANGSTALLTALHTAHPRIIAKLQRAAQTKREQN